MGQTLNHATLLFQDSREGKTRANILGDSRQRTQLTQVVSMDYVPSRPRGQPLTSSRKGGGLGGLFISLPSGEQGIWLGGSGRRVMVLVMLGGRPQFLDLV